MDVRVFKVGGCVRDAFLGVKSKDIDYAVEAASFNTMREYIVSLGGKIWLEKPEYLTIRAKVGKEDADYVLCRKDGAYSDARRPDSVEMGTIDDDLARRDFTMNAIAHQVDAPANTDPIYDPFNGVIDIERKTIRCVGDAFDRLNEDPLRILRAIRFSITKGFDIHPDTKAAMTVLQDKIATTVSTERVKDELTRCFAFSTLRTMDALQDFKVMRDSLFDVGALWLEPTSKGR